MSQISTSIEVDRPAGEVFAYDHANVGAVFRSAATDPTRFHEWQQGARKEMPANVAALKRNLEL